MTGKMRLDKLLSNMGKGTRSTLKPELKRGVVSVNGKCIKDGSIKVDPNEDEIIFEGEKVIYRPFVYLMLNKPQDYISATEDKRHPVVISLVPEAFRHYDVFPVGRLDIDTEGLLILTNDGALAHRVLSPKKHVPKVYEATLKMSASSDYIEIFKKGVTLEDGYTCQPANLQIDTVDEKHITLTIFEGKFHQVKRMFEAVGNEVDYLKRVKMGGVWLDPALALGEMRLLTDEEVELIEQQTV